MLQIYLRQHGICLGNDSERLGRPLTQVIVPQVDTLDSLVGSEHISQPLAAFVGDLVLGQVHVLDGKLVPIYAV